jgi:acetyl esterase
MPPFLDIDPTQIGVAGDSAGGNLAAAVCLKAREAASVRLSFQVLIYPALDPDMDYPSARDNAEGYGLTTEAMRWFWDHYVPDAAQRDNPLASPAIVVTAGYDPLRDEGERYADRLEEAGVPVIRRRYPAIHGFLWMAGALTDDFRQLMDGLATDVQTILSSVLARASSG